MISNSILPTDARLVRQTLRGRRDSFDRLVERHINGIYAVALARTRNHSDAEDVVQDAFVQAYVGLDTLRDPGKFGGWVATIARNAAAQVLMRRKREPGPLNRPPTAIEENAPDPSREELHAILRDEVNELDGDAREVLLLHYFAGYSAREIADRLEITRDAALKRLQRSRKKLAENVVDQLEGALDRERADTQKRIRNVTRALAALAAPWAGKRAAASVFAKPALLVGCVGAAIVITVAFMLGGNRATSPPTRTAALNSTAPLTSPVVEQPMETVPPPIESSDPIEQISTAPPVAVVEETPSLDGLWTLHQPKDSKWPDGHDWPALATVEIIQHENQLSVVKLMPISDREWRAEGTLEDGQIVFPLLDIFGIMVGGTRSAQQIAENPMISGPASATDTRIQIEGILPPYGPPLSEPPQEFVVVMNKLRDNEAQGERSLRQQVATAQQIRDAILAYAYDHNGRLPRTLADLVPRYIDDRDTVTDNDARTLIYNPNAVDLMTAVWSTSDWSTFRPDLGTRERVLAWEQERVAAYGEQFPDPIELLQVRVGSTGVTIRAGFHDEPEIDDPDRLTLGQPNADGDAAWAERARADACMHQMKGAGLGIVQFWDTTDERYNPAGWRSLVPDYLDDPSLLTCPSHAPGTLSYEMVFPAMSRAEVTTIYANHNGLDPDTVTPDEVTQAIPMVVETIPHMIDGREFRAALFLDGHVGMFHDRDWAKYVAPYMSYAVR